MKVKFSKTFKAKGGKEYKEGDVLDITDATAKTLTEKGFAAEYVEPEVDVEVTETPKESETDLNLPTEETEIEKAVSKGLLKALGQHKSTPPITIQDVRVVNKKYRGRFSSEEMAYGFGCLLFSKGLVGGKPNPLSGLATERIKNGFGGRLSGYTSKDVTAFSGTGTIPTIWIAELVKLMQQYGVARRNCWMHPMSTNLEYLPKSTVLPTVYAVDQASAIPTSNLGDTKLSLQAIKRGLVSYMPREVIEDAIVAYAEEQSVIISRAFARSEDMSLFNGDGTTGDTIEYFSVVGIGAALSADENSFIRAATGATGTGTTAITLTDFLACTGAIPPAFDVGDDVKWYMNKAMYFNVAIPAALASGAARLVEIMSLVSGPRSQVFCGYPVVFTQVMPSTVSTDTGEFIAYLGNLKLGTAFGVRREYAIESTLYGPGWLQDLISFRATERVAQTVFGTSTIEETAGPIVGLRVKAAE